MLRFSVPLRVSVSKKKDFILNLNNYRNAHHRVLSNAKNNFEDIIQGLRLKNELRGTYENPVRITYIYYPASNRKYDSMNVASIIDKFLMDSLVKCGVLRDDTYKDVLWPIFIHGGVDRENPRCDVEIDEIINHKQPSWWK